VNSTSTHISSDKEFTGGFCIVRVAMPVEPSASSDTSFGAAAAAAAAEEEVDERLAPPRIHRPIGAAPLARQIRRIMLAGALLEAFVNDRIQQETKAAYAQEEK
jgi:hypothetical protein